MRLSRFRRDTGTERLALSRVIKPGGRAPTPALSFVFSPEHVGSYFSKDDAPRHGDRRPE